MMDVFSEGTHFTRPLLVFLPIGHTIVLILAAFYFPTTVGKQTPITVRFSSVGGEVGSADQARDPR